MSTLSKKVKVTPGEKVAVIEEFNSGVGTYLKESDIRSLQIGEVFQNLSERKINIRSKKRNNDIPQPGDIIIGVVESSQSSVVNICIQSINGKRSTAGFTGMLQLLPNRSSGREVKPKRGSICGPGDIVRALVFSNINSINHLSIDRPDFGVIKSTCNICGGNFMRFSDRLKCTNCGNVVERVISSEFDNK
ncbi:exosome complex RNA-binding protein Csl4 [Thermoproteota archaeon]